MTPIVIDIDEARKIIARQFALLRRCRRAMLRVTINRVTADEWETIDPGLMALLKEEVKP